MATFLEICQKVARQSGVIEGVKPSTTAGQSGDLLKVVEWVKEAWRNIQNMEGSWRWMKADLPSSTALTIGNQRYTGASFSLDRFAMWPRSTTNFTVQDPSLTAADKHLLRYCDWYDFRYQFLLGSIETQRPTYYSISPQNELVMNVKPDLAYIIEGEYHQSPQELTADDDVPEMPARFHDAIVYLAWSYLAEHDEGGALAMTPPLSRMAEIMDGLRRDQLREVRDMIQSRPLA